MIIRVIEPFAREYIESRKKVWAQHPEIETLRELEKEHFVYVDTPKSNLETESLVHLALFASSPLIP